MCKAGDMRKLRELFRFVLAASHPGFLSAIWRNRRILIASAKSGAGIEECFSQDGEDIFLSHYFREPGLYVDVGAHHPIRFSVTKRLYDQGWSGLNIDVVDQKTEKLFRKERQRDFFHSGLVGPRGEKDFWVFDERALNTLEEETARELISSGWSLNSVQRVDIHPLDEVISQYLAGRSIDFLSIDAEQFDLKVLKTVDLDSWGINHVLVEVGVPAWQIHETSIGTYLEDKGFKVIAVWQRSAFFARSTQEVCRPNS